MTAAPDGALAPQGCAMDAAVRPEPRAFGARIRGPGPAHLMLLLTGVNLYTRMKVRAQHRNWSNPGLGQLDRAPVPTPGGLNHPLLTF